MITAMLEWNVSGNDGSVAAWASEGAGDCLLVGAAALSPLSLLRGEGNGTKVWLALEMESLVMLFLMECNKWKRDGPCVEFCSSIKHNSRAMSLP